MPWKNIVDAALEFLFPTHCVSCEEAGALFCEKCRTTLRFEETVLPDTISFYRYRDRPVARLVWALKYEGLSGTDAAIASLMDERLIEELAERSMMEHFIEPVLTIVPASKRRLRRYRHNHLEALGRELARAAALEYDPLILEIARETGKPQMSLSREERLVNLEGAFRARADAREHIAGRNIIVLDDVVTTGATLSEARRALMEAGAKRVVGLTFAH